MSSSGPQTPPHAETSLSDWYRSSPYASFVVDQKLDSASNVSAVLVQQPRGEYFSPPTTDFTIIHNPTQRAVPVHVENAAARYSSIWSPRNLDFGIPGGRYKCVVDDHHRGLFTSLDANRMAAAADLSFDEFLNAVNPLFESSFCDDLLGKLTQALFNEMQNPEASSTLFVESTINLITARVLRLAGAKSRFNPGGKLSHEQKVLLLDTIEDLLDTDLSAATLAALANRPISTFHQVFKEAFGQSPHSFVLERRITRAREMLGNSSESIASIAYACGFSSQQHMTNTFTAKLGVSPGKYRRQKRA